jgi:hypothetical protein
MNKLLLHLLILPFLFFLLSPICYLSSPICYAYPPGWSDDILINEDTSNTQTHPDVSTDSENNVWITWVTASFFDGEIYYSKRDSLGNSLISETNISNNESNSFLSRVVVDASDNVHVIWRDESPQGYGVWYAKLANDGSVIVPSHLAVSGAGGIGISTLEPEIALNKYQEVNIAWDEGPSGYNQMDYTKLDSLGDTLIAKIQVTPIDAGWVGIGVDSFANNHMACRTDTAGTSNRLTYSKLDKDGNFLVYNKVLATGLGPALVSDQHQNIHMVYTKHTTYRNDIDYLKLDNDGNILIGPLTISLPQINSNTYSHMAIDSLQYLHVVWQADSSAIVDIMYAKMDTAGNFVIPPMKVVYPQGGGEPRIAVDRSNRLHLVWVSGRLGTPDIFYKRGENEPGVEETAGWSAPGALCLEVYPNPFTQMTDIRYEITDEKHSMKDIELKIYDVTSRLVRQFDHKTIRLSDYITWFGDDDSGREVPAGVYFVRMTSATWTQTIPLILVR